MKVRMLVLSGAAMLAALTASAIDRNASMIDSAAIAGYRSSTVRIVTLDVWGENALVAPRRDWAILVNLGFGQAKPAGGASGNTWAAGLGVKYYLTELASLSLVGRYETWGGDSGVDVASGTLGFKYRFLSAEEVVSPFATCGVAFQGITRDIAGTEESDSLSEAQLSVGVGCDFLLKSDMALVMQGAFFQPEKLAGDGAKLDNGWTASAGLAYYWE
jgi:hypothetical protein